MLDFVITWISLAMGSSWISTELIKVLYFGKFLCVKSNRLGTWGYIQAVAHSHAVPLKHTGNLRDTTQGPLLHSTGTTGDIPQAALMGPHQLHVSPWVKGLSLKPSSSLAALPFYKKISPRPCRVETLYQNSRWGRQLVPDCTQSVQETCESTNMVLEVPYLFYAICL